MNYIQQNARDLVVGLRELKWKAFGRQLLTPPEEDNFDCAPPSDLPHIAETDEQRLQRLEEDVRLLDPTTQTNVQDARLVEAVARQRELLFANEDTTHLPQQVHKQIQFIIGDYYV